jgi:hypothetical protein
MSSSAPQKREELSGATPNRMRSSSGHWSSPHRPGRSTTDANGSLLVSRLHATPSSKSSSLLRPHVPDPITPPPPSLQSPHVFRPVVSTSTPTESSHLFTPVASAASPSKSVHNFKPVVIDESPSPKSAHNFKPIIFDDPQSPISPHTFEPIVVSPEFSLKTPRKSKSVVFTGSDVVSGHSFAPSSSAPVKSPPLSGTSSLTPIRKSKCVVFPESDIVAGPSFVPSNSASIRSPPLPDPSTSTPIRKSKSVIFAEAHVVVGASPTPSSSAPVRSPHFPSPLTSATVRKSKRAVYPKSDIVAGRSFASPSSAFKHSPCSSAPSTSSPVRPRPSFVPDASVSVQPQHSPEEIKFAPSEFVPSEAGFTNPRPARFKTRYKPYVPRPRPNPKVTFPNGLDGNNPYPRPYGGGWRNHRYHLFERLSRSKLLVDPYAKPDKRPWNWFLKKWFTKKLSSHNYYGGRSAAQRESTRYVHRANDEVPGEAYEMDDLSTPEPNGSDTPAATTPKSFVGTAVTILQAVRKDLKVSLTKARDPAGNIYFYEKAYVPRFTKHSLRPSKRMFSIRNFLNHRLYGRPGDGANVLMAHVPIDVSIPGVDDIDRRKILAAARCEAEPKQKEHPCRELWRWRRHAGERRRSRFLTVQ